MRWGRNMLNELIWPGGFYLLYKVRHGSGFSVKNQCFKKNRALDFYYKTKEKLTSKGNN